MSSAVPLAAEESMQQNDQGTAISDMQKEIKSLEEIIDKLDREKRALKMRLNEVGYYRKFQAAHCRKWLQANYDFDRRDTPELLASIFEDYLMQNEELSPLPHQLIVKNSAKGQRRRQKLLVAQSPRPRKVRDTTKAGALSIRALTSPMCLYYRVLKCILSKRSQEAQEEHRRAGRH